MLSVFDIEVPKVTVSGESTCVDSNDSVRLVAFLCIPFLLDLNYVYLGLQQNKRSVNSSLNMTSV